VREAYSNQIDTGGVKQKTVLLSSH